ncbi:MAG: hypothetical protein ACYCOO_02485 [Chitinophagaceae bacterium]
MTKKNLPTTSSFFERAQKFLPRKLPAASSWKNEEISIMILYFHQHQN